jgi:predicted nucleic acid-binding protein
LLSTRPVSIDTCTLINVLASGVAEILLQQLSAERLISEAVSRESLFLRSALVGQPPQRIDLNPFIHAGYLKVCQAETVDEEELYVHLASELDDGEAMSVAISVSRGHALATDDRKATRLAKQLGLLYIYSTPDIIASCSGINLPEVLGAIEFRARFVPALDHPLRDWWVANNK